MALALQHRDQMYRQHRHDEAVEGERNRKRDEGPAARPHGKRACLRRCACSARSVRRCQAWHKQEMQRQADRDLQRREKHHGIAPAEPLQPFQRCRPEHSAGEAPHQRQRGQRCAIARTAVLA